MWLSTDGLLSVIDSDLSRKTVKTVYKLEHKEFKGCCTELSIYPMQYSLPLLLLLRNHICRLLWLLQSSHGSCSSRENPAVRHLSLDASGLVVLLLLLQARFRALIGTLLNFTERQRRRWWVVVVVGIGEAGAVAVIEVVVATGVV